MGLIKINQKVNIAVFYTQKKLSSGFSKITIYDQEEKIKLQQEIKQLQQKYLLANQNNQAIPPFVVPQHKQIQVLSSTWKILNWRQSQQLTQSCMKTDDQFDWVKYRDLKLKKCLAGWDLKDDNNNLVPCQPNMIDLLPPQIVVALINKYDKATTKDDEDEKK